MGELTIQGLVRGTSDKQRRCTVVVDESTRIKNPRAKRTRFVQRVGMLAAKRRILTGMVAPRSPMDLYAQSRVS